MPSHFFPFPETSDVRATQSVFMSALARMTDELETGNYVDRKVQWVNGACGVLITAEDNELAAEKFGIYIARMEEDFSEPLALWGHSYPLDDIQTAVHERWRDGEVNRFLSDELSLSVEGRDFVIEAGRLRLMRRSELAAFTEAVAEGRLRLPPKRGDLVLHPIAAGARRAVIGPRSGAAGNNGSVVIRLDVFRARPVPSG